MRKILLAGAETVPGGHTVTGWAESLPKTGNHLINKPHRYHWKTKIFCSNKIQVEEKGCPRSFQENCWNPTVPSWTLLHSGFVCLFLFLFHSPQPRIKMSEQTSIGESNRIGSCAFQGSELVVTHLSCPAVVHSQMDLRRVLPLWKGCLCRPC